MTEPRHIKCKNPYCPHEKQLQLSDWFREALPDSALGFYLSDIDFIVYNETTQKIGLLEVKTRNKQIPEWQRRLLLITETAIKNGLQEWWQYAGFFSIRFENYFFNDGKCYLNDKEISQEELKRKLETI